MPKAKYRVKIERMSKKAQQNWGPEYRWHVSMQKEYGNLHGEGRCCRSKEEVMTLWQRMRRDWEGYDSILNRQGDKVTMNNLLFSSCTKEVTKEELVLSTRRLL